MLVLKPLSMRIKYRGLGWFRQYDAELEFRERLLHHKVREPDTNPSDVSTAQLQPSRRGGRTSTQP